jgi:hypothetical protein
MSDDLDWISDRFPPEDTPVWLKLGDKIVPARFMGDHWKLASRKLATCTLPASRPPFCPSWCKPIRRITKTSDLRSNEIEETRRKILDAGEHTLEDLHAMLKCEPRYLRTLLYNKYRIRLWKHHNLYKAIDRS